MKLRHLSLSLSALSLLAVLPALSQTTGAPRSNITTPKQQFGFNIGDDYLLANYTQETGTSRSSPPSPTA